METIDILKFAFLTTTTICSICTFLFLLLSKRTRISIHSHLHKVDGKHSAIITVTNKGEKAVVISSIRFPIVAWRNDSRLEIPKLLKILRVIDDLTDSNSLSIYASDQVATYNHDTNKTLSEGESITATIPLDDMMQVVLDANECFFASKLLNHFYFYFMSIYVETSKGLLQKKRAMWEIRYYLISRYGSNDQLANKEAP